MAGNSAPPQPSSEAEQPDPKRQKMSITSTSDEERIENAAPIPRTPKYKRRKIAIFFAYCGVGYQGMQKNPGAKTIEGDFEEALYFAGAVPEEERGKPRRFDWARSARTDKGVSAACQVVSGKFYVDPPGFVERLNSHLSPQIRVFGYKRVTPLFNAKKFCDRRRYVYLLPVFAIDPSRHRDRESVLASVGSVNELIKCVECSERGRKAFDVMGRRCYESKVEGGDGGIGSGISSNDGRALVEDKVVVDCCVDDETRTNDSEQNSSIENGNVEAHGSVDGNGSVSGKIKDLFENGAGNDETKKEDEPRTEEMNEFCYGEVEKERFDLEQNYSIENGNVEARVKEVLVEDKIAENYSEKGNDDGGNGNASNETKNLFENGEENIRLEKEDKSETEKKSEFSYGEAEKEKFNRILKYYEGRHNFHNFTTRTKAEDPAAKRYIISFNANTVLNIDGIDFIKCEVVGQSFMLHQIRKMIGLAVAVMRNSCPESIMEKAFEQKVKINVPMAPEVGLYLDECFFSSYNQKWKDTHEEMSLKDHAEEAEDFRVKYIHPHVGATEHKYGTVAVWLHSLNHRNYPDLRGVDDATVLDEDKV